MTEQRKALASLFVACWKDQALKARLLNEPKAVLDEYGIDVPDDADVTVLENSESTVYITIPASPTATTDLSDDELANSSAELRAATSWLGLMACTMDNAR